MQQSWREIADAIKAAQASDSWKELGRQLSAAREEYARMKKESGALIKDIKLSMLRRCYAHDYSQPDDYMITLVAEDREAQPFGRVECPSGNPKEAQFKPSAIGQAMLDALDGMEDHYPMVVVHKAQLMPDHLHFILRVKAPIISSTGKESHIGQIIAGYKKGCNRAYWELIGLAGGASEGLGAAAPRGGASEGKLPNTNADASLGIWSRPLGGASEGKLPNTNADASLGKGVGQFPCPRLKASASGSPCPSKSPGAKASSGRPPIWARGYTDTIITGYAHLVVEEAYLNDNPRRLVIKRQHRELFRTVYHVRIGELEYAAIGNIFLLRKAWKEQVQFHHWEHLCPPGYRPCTRAWDCSRFYKEGPDGRRQYYTCPSGGAARSEADAHTERLLKAADAGAIGIGPFISDREKAVRDALLTMGCPYIRLTKEGFTDLYTPSKSEFNACAEGLLLILAPWGERKRKEKITRAECLELNEQARLLCSLDLEMHILQADGFESILETREDD